MNIRIKPSDLQVPALHWVVIKKKHIEKPIFGTIEATSVDEVTDRLAVAANEAEFLVLRDVMVRWDDVEDIHVHLMRERTY